MKSARAILEKIKLKVTGDPPENDDEVGMLLSSISRYAGNAIRYSVKESDRGYLRDELESIIEDAAEVLASISDDADHRGH